MVLLSPPKNNVAQSNFVKRTLTTAVAGPIAVGAVLLGSPYVDMIAIILLVTLLWEWSKMSGLPLTHPINGVVILLMGWAIFGTGTFLPAFILMTFGFLFILYYHYQIEAKLLPPSFSSQALCILAWE